MEHKCDGCKYKGEHQEMMFKPMGVCLKEHNLIEAVKAYNAEKCPFTVPRQGEWISVDERLPDEAVRVLVWLREPSAILRFVQFDTDRIVDGHWVRWNNHITHWMPLPEPPKMKGGAE